MPFPDSCPADHAAERVLIGPVNSAGQGYLWARALERARPDLLPINLKVSSGSDKFNYPADLTVNSGYSAYSRKWQRNQTSALEGYRAVLIESASPVLGGAYRGDVLAQIDALQRRNVQLGLLFHGSDLRDPDMHLATEPDSYFSVDSNFTESMRQKTRRSRALIEESGLPVLVSTPDLLREVEGAKLLPIVVDPKVWATTDLPFQTSRRPCVVHAPSSSHIKGTDLIDKTMHRLHRLGLIEYRRLAGMRHREMLDVYRSADIVLDQFRGGPYGVAACEALAAGRIVVSHVPVHVRKLTHELSGLELPIVQSTAAELEDVVASIVADPGDALKRANQGPGFISHWHDGRESGHVLSQWLDSRLPS
ncbi:hypothetical protein SAMN04488565_1263 [Leucobacter chromiiresistens]|uniref:Uncharacterized protein n=2 Tax=Leucobacter chromiiresistens TaxID=1079994 RepID=A0A1H0YX53_9MICO|nr:hypothetical protein SAMN04488565_1263 [Leucobacter chromiiresistens]